MYVIVISLYNLFKLINIIIYISGFSSFVGDVNIVLLHSRDQRKLKL